MSNDGQKPQGSVAWVARQNNGFFPSSFRSFSGYLRFVSSGASTVASTVRSAASAASSIVDRNDVARGEQVLCAGFDQLECEDGTIRHILLLGCQSGFQVWDVEEADNVHDLVMRHDGAVCFLQMLPRPVSSIADEDKFAISRPLLVVCSHGSFSLGNGIQEGVKTPSDDSIANGTHGPGSGLVGPFTVQFYSLTSQTYVHHLKFRTAVYSVRCSSRVIAILQAAQVHCFNAATLEREYTILTNPVSMASLGSGGIGYGPLAVGPRWLAYSGSIVAISDSGRVSPQQLTYSASFPNNGSNGSLVAHYAKESSKQLAQGIVTLGDMGYKKLARYYSELHPDSDNYVRSIGVAGKANGTINGHVPDVDSVGMVIVRDILNKSIIAQFRAHKSPISALCFDPSGTLLVTASVHGHNINVFRIMPGVRNSTGSDPSASCLHLYRLQRGFTDAVIQDISFSDDSRWIMVGTSRGTNHLFTISSSVGSANLQSSDANNLKMNGLREAESQFTPRSENLIAKSSGPVTLSAVNRIRSYGNGWKGTAAAAAGRISSFCGVTASSFHQCRGSNLANAKTYSLETCLLIFSPSGSLIQYSIRESPKGVEATTTTIEGSRPGHDPVTTGSDSEMIVEAVKKWNIIQKQRQRDRDNGFDIYGERGNPDYNKVFPDGGMNGIGMYSVDRLLGVATEKKAIAEEKRNLYISQAELHMHPQQIPFWAKSGIYFQAMILDGAKMDDERNAAGCGEIEIERLATCLVEVRLKDLVPVFDYLPSPRSQNVRTAGQQNRSPRYLNNKYQNGDLLIGNQPSTPFEHQLNNINNNGFGGGISLNDGFLSRSQSSSYQSSKNGNYIASPVLNNGSTIDDTSPKIKSIITTTGNYVNSTDDSNPGTGGEQLDDDHLVNNNRDREDDDINMGGAGAQFKFVNSYHEAPRVGSEANEFD